MQATQPPSQGYINLLDECGMLRALHKYSIDMARRKASIPKLQVYNNALKTLYCPQPFSNALTDPRLWGRILESAVGAFLVSEAFTHRIEVAYWRERNNEVDFILRKQGRVVAVEVKGNAEKNTAGLSTFRQLFNPHAAFIVGDGGIPTGEFMTMDVRNLF